MSATTIAYIFLLVMVFFVGVLAGINVERKRGIIAAGKLDQYLEKTGRNLGDW